MGGMKRKHATVLMGVGGVLIFCLVVVLAGGAWFFAAAFESASADERAASAAFDDVRGRFSNVDPVFDIVGDDAVRRRAPPAAAAAAPLQTLRLRHWGPDDDRMEDVSIPFWLLRFKAGAISATSSHVGLRNVTAQDIERYGPTLLVDHEGRRGDRLLIWTE